jgi:creatinine amidohydrolase/Fe(II)-dependent formamide hydrolase-like protein
MAERNERIREWKDLTGPALTALDREHTVVVVSCSPLEVHGPHLPVSADMCEAEGLLHRTMELLLERDAKLSFVRLPPIYVAADVLPHRGSLKFRASTVVRVLTELGTTLARQGFKDIWVANFHGGPRHFVAIERAAHDVNRRAGARMLSVFGLLLKELTGGSSDLATLLGGMGGITEAELRGDSHGGLIETALLLHLTGENVDPAFAQLPPRSLEIVLRERGEPPLQKGERPTALELIRSFPLKQRYYEVETYAGAPAKASPELGKRYLDVLAGKSADALAKVLSGERALRDVHSPLWPMRHVILSRAVGWLFDRLVPVQRSPV